MLKFELGAIHTKGFAMIIKTGGYELEISQGSNIYLGSIKTGQTFKSWSDIDENVRAGLTEITQKIERLVAESEKLLIPV